MAKPTVVKVLQKTSHFPYPERFAYSPDYLFVTDVGLREYDWLVVYDEFGSVEELACPRERTILATWEPMSIKSYSRAYTRQFGHLLTNRPPEAENHPHHHLGRGYFYWFNDRDYAEAVSVAIPPKKKLISAVCSSKQMKHTKHYARYALVKALAEALPELDWYGHGVKSFGKKHEVMDPYKYHVAIENHIGVHHWTEKIADSILSECLTFYAGDPDLGNVLPFDSFIPIPIDDPDEAVRIVKAAIASGEYEKRREAILEAKRLILTKYNFWAQVISVIESAPLNSQRSTLHPQSSNHLYPRKELRKHSLSAALEDGWWHLRQYLGAVKLG